jgi:hypothetical protein
VIASRNRDRASCGFTLPVVILRGSMEAASELERTGDPNPVSDEVLAVRDSSRGVRPPGKPEVEREPEGGMPGAALLNGGAETASWMWSEQTTRLRRLRAIVDKKLQPNSSALR